jgi:ESF2/ABP1 family protein
MEEPQLTIKEHEKEHSKAVKNLFKKSIKEKQKGIVYISRVPPYMNPSSLRKLMESRFKGLERIYLEREKEQTHRDRVKTGGNRKSKYTEGWVEFESKEVAKNCALLLNNKQIGGKKRHNLFYDDILNVKYLSGFQWSHLSEKLTYDHKMREQRLTTETNRAKKEMTFFDQKRELSKKLGKIEESRIKNMAKLDEREA